MLHLFLALTTVAAAVLISRPVPTEELLQDRFALGQKYYAASDHENSVEVFQQIEQTPNFALLDVDHIQVAIDDLVLPLRVAATYQLGNSHRNVGRTLLTRSQSLAAEGDTAASVLRRQESLAAFDRARQYYRRLVEDEARSPRNLRVMSQYQIVRASYQTEDYPTVVAETRVLLDRFPGSEYEEAALYDRGWAFYHMGEHHQAIDTFGRLLSVSKDPLKRDRALFQMAESYAALGQHDQARAWYGRLVSAYDFAELSDKELLEMKTQRLRGLVQETTRELVAKAQIRIADSYASEGRIDEAIAAYSRVPERFPQESLLVQKSFDNMATMVLERQGVDPGVRVLRQAIEQVVDPHFRGRAQLRIASVFLLAGRHREAIAEYDVYRRAYGDQALAIGVGLDQVLFAQGEAYRELSRAGGGEAESRAALAAYRQVVDTYPHSLRVPEAYYGLGQAFFAVGQLDSAATCFSVAVRRHPESPVAPHALSGWARVALRQGLAEESVDRYRELIASYPGSALVDQTWKDLGLVYKQMGRIEDALDALTTVSPGFEAWPKVQAEAAETLLAAGRLDEIGTRLDLRRAVERAAAAGDDESVAELHYVLGRVARERADQGAQVEHFTRSLARTGNPDMATYSLFFRGLAHYQWGAAQDAAGDSASGESHFEASVADLESVLASAVAADIRSVAFRTRGVALTRLGRSAQAVRAYEDLIAAAPSPLERAEFELMLMELHYDLGQLQQTEASARSLVEGTFEEEGAGGFSIRDRAYFVLVSVLLEQERYEEAQRTASAALRQFPDSENRPALMLASARALFYADQYEQAAAGFGAFIDGNPSHPDLPSAHFQLGVCREIAGQYEGAAGAFRALAARFPTDPLVAEALYRGGENLYNASRFQEALDLFLQVVDMFPQTEAAQKALYSAGWTYMDLDQEEASLGAMARLVANYPGSGLARYAQFSIGDYYYSRKRFEEAQQAYQKVISFFPQSEEAGKARALLGDLEEDLASREYDRVFGDFQKGDYAEAARGFDSIYADHPGSYAALAALANKAVALEHLGNNEEARRTYERVLSAAANSAGSGDIANFARLRLESM